MYYFSNYETALYLDVTEMFFLILERGDRELVLGFWSLTAKEVLAFNCLILV
jgi:hypothetical protein